MWMLMSNMNLYKKAIILVFPKFMTPETCFTKSVVESTFWECAVLLIIVMCLTL